eukprot:TRINITY_DN1877_c0_g1_i2.p1 TRINITY_DN1877_c0_g1~~TRINITY_DN1877_c0_g1_i2.p1  ORF type:complete len:345 (-),score=26.89 TRINITY_DN1877_c0_g1_i2:463-1497(-)
MKKRTVGKRDCYYCRTVGFTLFEVVLALMVFGGIRGIEAQANNQTTLLPIRFLHAFPSDIVLDVYINISPYERSNCLEVTFGSFCKFDLEFPTGKPLNYTIIDHKSGSVIYYSMSFSGLRYYNTSTIGYNLIYAPRDGSDVNVTTAWASLKLLPDIYPKEPPHSCFYIHVANYLASNLYEVIDENNDVFTYDLPYGVVDVTSDTCWPSETYNVTALVGNYSTSTSKVPLGAYLAVAIGSLLYGPDHPFGPQLALRTLVPPESGGSTSFGSNSGSEGSSSSGSSSESSDSGSEKHHERSRAWLYIVVALFATVSVVAGVFLFRRYRRSRTEYDQIALDTLDQDAL